MSNEKYLIGANDEHGVNPPTPGKRTPQVPGLNRQIYENEFNRAAKNAFIEGLLRNGFSVYDVKPELQDLSISTRVSRINRRDLTLLVTFAYNAFGTGNSFNSASGVTVYYSEQNLKANQSRMLAEELYEALTMGTEQRGRGVRTLTDVGVLTAVNCPSALIEAGFMTNLREASLMLDPDFITEVGEESVKGVCNYLGVGYVPRELNNFMTVRRGSRGNFVSLLQFILNGYGYDLDTDGVFGAITEDAVKDFQRKNGLTEDGVVGGNTWKTLLTLPPFPTLKKGDGGAYVKYLQRKLESYFIPVGSIDGVFGQRTENAVKEFQQRNGLETDGIVGKNTWAALTKER